MHMYHMFLAGTRCPMQLRPPQYRYCDGTQVQPDIALYQKETTTTVAETAGAGSQQERFVSPQTLSGETVHS